MRFSKIAFFVFLFLFTINLITWMKKTKKYIILIFSSNLNNYWKL